MSFHEKSAWACLVSICFVYVPYFVVVLQFPLAALGLFWLATFGLISLLIAFHVAIGLATRTVRTIGNTPPVDELDRVIELNASKWAGFALAFAVMTWVLMVMYSLPVLGKQTLAEVNAPNSDLMSAQAAIPMFKAMLGVHWLFAGFVIANLVYYGGIVLGYRRLASA